MGKGKDEEKRPTPTSNEPSSSKFEPFNNAEWVQSLQKKDVITPERAEELVAHRIPEGSLEIGRGYGPVAPIVRPGHFEYIDETLRPKTKSSNEEIEIVPVNSLERSSSSFLRLQKTPPSTASEDEVSCHKYIFIIL
jgi:hypothetical protein